MFLVFGNGKWCQNHQRILTELNVKFVLIDLPLGADFVNIIDSDCDGVFIVCSTANHFPILLHCFHLGVPVFCEKPICVKRKHLDILKSAFDFENQIFMSGHQLVFDKNINDCLAPTYFNSMRAGAIPRTEGAILSLAVHDIAVAQSIFKTEYFKVLSVEGNIHECKIILESFPGKNICEIYVSSFSKIRLRNISIADNSGMVLLQPDNWLRNDLLKLELKYFIDCIKENKLPIINNFKSTEIIMETIFDIMNKLGG